MANEFTLADYEATAPDPLQKAMVRTWREASPILDMLKFKTSNRLSEKILRFGALPTVPWRKIGESYTQVKITPDSVEERLYFMGAKIDIAKEYVKADSLINQRKVQEEATLKGMAYGFNEAFFINTPLVDEDAIVGLWYRLINDMPAAQSVDAAGLDISPDTAVTNVSHKFFDLLDATLAMVEGNPADKVIFLNWTLWKRAQSLMRQSQLLDVTTDQIGRQFLTYGKGGPRLVDVGYKADQSTMILPDTETAAGTALTTSTFSSFYVVRFGEPYVSGWAMTTPSAEDVGLLEDRVNYRTVVDFAPGLIVQHPRAMARAYDIQAA